MPASEPHRIRLYETNSKCCKFSSFDFQLCYRRIMQDIKFIRCDFRKKFSMRTLPRSDFLIRQRCSYGSACLHSAVPSLSCKRNLQPKFFMVCAFKVKIVTIRYDDRTQRFTRSAPIRAIPQSQLFTCACNPVLKREICHIQKQNTSIRL